MDNEFSYSIVRWKNDNAIPLLNQSRGCPKYLYSPDEIKNPELMRFRFGDPIPKNPKMADYHVSPNPVVSKKIFDVLEPMHISGIQLLPAVIEGNNKEVFDQYWAIHIFHLLKCVDVKLSDCKFSGERLSHINKLVLDVEVLKKIPLKERLVFSLLENTAYDLFHSSVVDAIMATQPTGIRFIHVDDVNERRLFSD